MNNFTTLQLSENPSLQSRRMETTCAHPNYQQKPQVNKWVTQFFHFLFRNAIFAISRRWEEQLAYLSTLLISRNHWYTSDAPSIPPQRPREETAAGPRVKELLPWHCDTSSPSLCQWSLCSRFSRHSCNVFRSDLSNFQVISWKKNRISIFTHFSIKPVFIKITDQPWLVFFKNSHIINSK